MRYFLLVGLTAWFAAWAALGSPPAQAQLRPGDIAVVDYRAGTDRRGAVFTVDPGTGARTLLSDFGNPAQGPIGREPYAIARGPGGDLYVVDMEAGTDCFATGTSGCGALFRVDPSTGARTLVSDFGNPAQGPTGVVPTSLAVEAGTVLVVDHHAGTSNSGALFSVSASTGARTVLSDFGDPSFGPTGGAPMAVTFSPNGILVVDNFTATLYRVDGAGRRTVVSDFRDGTQGPLGQSPVAIAIDPVTGQALVADQIAGSGPDGLSSLFSVNLTTGARTVVSDFTTTAQGPPGINPGGVGVTGSGQILLVDFFAGSDVGALFAVDRATGRRCYLSDFGDPAQGPLGDEPSGLAIVPGGDVRLPLAAAVLPSSRSVQVGTPATAYVTIINAGCPTALGVGIALASPIDADFTYQTTDPATNAPTGTPNTPADIPGGASQTYVISITPRSPMPPTDVAFAFAGTNTASVPATPGLNTLLLSASTTPVPDIVALAATLNNDGIVAVPASGGVFSVATVNVGASGDITVSADTGAVALPLDIQLCETNPATGQCTSALGPQVQITIAAGATPTFGVFLTALAPVAYDPAVNRVFVRFRDAGGATRGATSVAVRAP